MQDTKNIKNEVNTYEYDCEKLKEELEETKIKLKETEKLLAQYETSYKELQFKFNRLYGVLGNQIEYTLNIK